MNRLVLMTMVFSLGYMFNDLTEEMNIDLIPAVNAEVGGMDWYDLKYDYDFKKAVRKVVEKYCTVSGSGVDC